MQHLFLMAFLLGATGFAGAVEPVSVGDLGRAFAASQAMQQGDAGAASHPYRAGRFDGYLTALAESLQARGEICLPGCFCQVRERIDPLLEQALAGAGLDSKQPATAWLSARLRENFPCPAR